jgi:Rod binding domain-containing protein
VIIDVLPGVRRSHGRPRSVLRLSPRRRQSMRRRWAIVVGAVLFAGGAIGMAVWVKRRQLARAAAKAEPEAASAAATEQASATADAIPEQASATADAIPEQASATANATPAQASATANAIPEQAPSAK